MSRMDGKKIHTHNTHTKYDGLFSFSVRKSLGYRGSNSLPIATCSFSTLRLLNLVLTHGSLTHAFHDDGRIGFFCCCFFYLTYSRWTSSLPSWLWSLRIFPFLPGSRLTIFYRDASSAILQLVNQWLNFTYSRSHAFRYYGRKNTNNSMFVR